jgi:hypothetical protein
MIDYGDIVVSFSFEQLVLEADEAVDLFVICMRYSFGMLFICFSSYVPVIL